MTAVLKKIPFGTEWPPLTSRAMNSENIFVAATEMPTRAEAVVKTMSRTLFVSTPKSKASRSPIIIKFNARACELKIIVPTTTTAEVK